MLTGRIVKNISNTYVVKTTDREYACTPRGKFRNEGLTPLVGDIVDIDADNNYILKIEKRKNELDRPRISNVDYALIVTSMVKPDISLNLLDKEISSIILSDITPVICFTKIDLINEEEKEKLEKLVKYYQSIGIAVFLNNDLEPLKAYLKGKFIVLTGQTGAGKSSLINKLDPTKNIEVGEISIALGRGRHTTRHTEFHEVDDFYIADTPGFSSLDLSKYTKEEIRDSFLEFRNLSCEYRDCMHLKEVNCEVKEQVKNRKILESRYENYCNFLSK